MPQQSNRAALTRAISYDDPLSRAAMSAPYPSSYPTIVNPHTPFPPPHDLSSSSSPYTPKSTELGACYFSAAQTPIIQESNDPWDEALGFDGSVGKPMPYNDFGLGLGPIKTELSPMMPPTHNTGGFTYPPLSTELEPLAFDPGSPEGRSWSSISDSSTGFVTDFPDFSTGSDIRSANAEPLMPGFEPIYSRNGTSEFSHRRFSKSTSRCGVESSSPHARYRTSPYPMLNARNRSYSTGSVAPSRSQRSSPYFHNTSQSPCFDSHCMQKSSSSCNPSTMNELDFDRLCPPLSTGPADDRFDAGSFLHPSAAEDMSYDPAYPQIRRSPETANVLHSSGPGRSKCEHHFAGSSKPPDLFGPLQDKQLSPPPEDSNHDKAEMPRAQELRFEGDLYTPKYVRGHGNKREGWCGICKPGRWLVLKNSAFWYDKSFTHGISAATGSPFESPRETRRMKGNPDVWEGLCHSCGEWIALISSKKKGTTWFRHAYKCHTHQKVKDTPKRRREMSNAKSTKETKPAPVLQVDTSNDSAFLLDPAIASSDKEAKPPGDKEMAESLSAL